MKTPAFLHPFAQVARTDFVTIVRGRGARVWDTHGREYVDAMASLWYCNVGHGRAEIIDAVAQQMRTLASYHTFEKFSNEPSEALASAIADLAPTTGSRVFFTSSGSEAVDSAIKIARLAHSVDGAPERQIIISRSPSYHGVTYGGMAATGLPDNRGGFGQMLEGVVHVPMHDVDAVARIFKSQPGRVAAVIAEPVVGAGGVHPPQPGYLQALRSLCDAHGAWLILDEVICGFGRLGTWWGSERYGVQPDLTTFAKAVTSGYQPLGGVVVAPSVLDALAQDPELVLRHGHTYSGHPAACVAALANIELLRAEQLLERAGAIGEQLSQGLHRLHEEGRIEGVRGDGAVWAAALPGGLNAGAVRDRMLEHGVIARPLGGDTVVFCPPLVIEEEELDRCVLALERSLETIMTA